MLDHSISQYQPNSIDHNPVLASPPTSPNTPPISSPTITASSSPLEASPPPPVFGQESTPPSIPLEQADNPQVMQHQLNQAVTQVLNSSNTPAQEINHAAATIPVNYPYPVSPITSTPKEVSAAPPAVSLTTISSKIAQEIQEAPLVQTKALDQSQQKVSWKQAAVVGVGLFFAGALLAIIIMLMLY